MMTASPSSMRRPRRWPPRPSTPGRAACGVRRAADRSPRRPDRHQRIQEYTIMATDISGFIFNNIVTGENLASSETASSSTKARNFFEALGKALGEMLGKESARLVDAADRMVEHSEKKDGADFMEASTDFQVASQRFNIMSNTAATAIKAIGEGLTGLARKQ